MAQLHLRNPLQSRSSFSDSDISKLISPWKGRRRKQFIQVEYSENQGAEMFDEISNRPSIADRITRSGLLKNAENKAQVTHVMSIIFIEIFYRSVRKHLACPICNDVLRKPIILPSCGHTFCSHCLSSWFRQNIMRSCPVCRKFSSQNQKPVTVPTVDTFVMSVEKLWRHFCHSDDSFRGVLSIATLLPVLNLAVSKRNENVLMNSLPQSSVKFSSASLANINRKWAFMQLIHNLRFAQLQKSNKSGIRRPNGSFKWLQKYQRICHEMLKIILPGYTQLLTAIHCIKVLASGRGRILMRVPTPDQLCLILIAILLGCFVCTIFQFVLQRGLKAQLKLMLHFASVIVFNDLMEA